MTYRLLTGQYVIRYPELPSSGPEPDGDTIKFLPDDPTLVEDLGRISGTEPDFSAAHRISLRFEAVDALETHFGDTHQALDLADAARDQVLAALGFSDVVFDPQHPNKILSASADQLPGWILSNGIEAHGRIVAFLFTGTPTMANGAEVFLDADLVAESLNADLLTTGLTYPMLYSTLPASLRAPLIALSTAARAQRAGVWARSTADPGGLTGTGAQQLDQLEQLVMWPKLFRRLVSFYGGGNDNLDGFDSWLRANPKDRDDGLLLLDTMEPGNLHDVVTAKDGGVQLTRWPDSFVVLPDPSPIPPKPTQSRAGALRIVAALVDPAGTDRGAETVSLLNTTAGALDLTGWTLSDAHGTADPLDLTVAAGDVARFTLGTVTLANTGDTIMVKDATGGLVDRVSYVAKVVPSAGRTLVF